MTGPFADVSQSDDTGQRASVLYPADDEESVVGRYQQAMPTGRVEEFSTSGFDRTGIPACAASIFLDEARHTFGGQGYGTTDAQARIGAYGELTEGVRSWLCLSGWSRFDASYRELCRQRGTEAVQDPRTLGLPAGTVYDEDRPLQWLPMRRLADQAEIWVPAEFVASEPFELTGQAPAAGWLSTPVTNGLGAHSDSAAAIRHAVLEIVQRDGNGVVFRALDRGIELTLAGLADAGCVEILSRLENAGIAVQVKLASTEFGLTNLYVVGSAPDDDLVVATAIGEAADPDPVVALRKALLEFAAARPRKALMHGPLSVVERLAPPGYLERILPTVDPGGEEPRVLDSMVAWLAAAPELWRPWLAQSIFSRTSSVPFPPFPASLGLRPPSGPVDLPPPSDPVARLQAEGFDILVAELNVPPKQGAPAGFGQISAVKVVVPGLEVETVAYGRIGERNARRLLELGRDDLVHVGPPREGDERIVLTAAAQERLGGPTWLNRARLDEAVGNLYPLYREPGRHAAPLLVARRNASG